ncbi:hypothetical protein RyT2_14070 [Pseudolactococcus yaeyamensis]
MAKIYQMSKKQVKKLRKKTPNDLLKKRLKLFLLVMALFILSRPIGAMFSNDKTENGSQIGAEISKGNEVVVKLAALKSYDKEELLEVNLLVDVPANRVDFELAPEVYNAKKKRIKNVEIVKINPNFYTLFIPQTKSETFQYYIGLPEKGNVLDTVSFDDRATGFTITPAKAEEKTAFTARSMADYDLQSRELLSLNYSDGIKALEKEQAALRKENDKLKAKNEKLLANANNLTTVEKEAVASSIATNNLSIKSNESSILDKEKAKAPILEKLKALSGKEDKG